MIQALVLSLICGPAGVMLGLWATSMIMAARAHEPAVVRVLVERRTDVRRQTRRG